jgi:hypothetical protein
VLFTSFSLRPSLLTFDEWKKQNTPIKNMSGSDNASEDIDTKPSFEEDGPAGNYPPYLLQRLPSQRLPTSIMTDGSQPHVVCRTTIPLPSVVMECSTRSISDLLSCFLSMFHRQTDFPCYSNAFINKYILIIASVEREFKVLE